MATGNPTGTEMRGKRCLITGATSGIGLETARGLAARGADLVLVSRSLEKCQHVGEELKSIGQGTITHHAADLADPRSIQQLLKQIDGSYGQLDVLVNNAGAMYRTRQASPEGLELTWALNHLGYYRLTCSLLPLLSAAPSARIVCVASDAHRAIWRGLNWDDLQFERSKYRSFRAYCQSKFANVLFTRELSKKLEGTTITVNCLHPGFVASNFFDWPGVSGVVTRGFAGVFAILPVQGAQTSIYLASSPDVQNTTGGYFDRCKLTKPSPAARDDSAAHRLWELSVQTTGLDAVLPTSRA